ncbi:hypothetical protein E4Z66_15145 [Aliishimia ponticola]|uniref:Response regulatory domain-containing protein n=1 Tax=Aliishimia ponticola TaxID=2499833 RepID=A0A4S4NAU8_9RHOB|nr:hypothetical protein [Aliishimia ponticola]THH35158.1 hypothetical protein E4Z66_15145 [Aliishimia ponticola]
MFEPIKDQLILNLLETAETALVVGRADPQDDVATIDCIHDRPRGINEADPLVAAHVSRLRSNRFGKKKILSRFAHDDTSSGFAENTPERADFAGKGQPSRKAAVIVTADPEKMTTITDALEGLNMPIVCFDNSAEAMFFIRENGASIVFVDVSSLDHEAPRLLTTISELSGADGGSSIPVIVLMPRVMLELFVALQNDDLNAAFVTPPVSPAGVSSLVSLLVT